MFAQPLNLESDPSWGRMYRLERGAFPPVPGGGSRQGVVGHRFRLDLRVRRMTGRSRYFGSCDGIRGECWNRIGPDMTAERPVRPDDCGAVDVSARGINGPENMSEDMGTDPIAHSLNADIATFLGYLGRMCPLRLGCRLIAHSDRFDGSGFCRTSALPAPVPQGSTC